MLLKLTHTRLGEAVVGSGSHPLKDYLDRYALRHPGIAASTIRQYGYTLTAWAKSLGRDAIVADLNEQSVLKFFAARLIVVSKRSVKRERQVVMSLWRSAAREQMVSSPPSDIPAIPQVRRQPVAWSLDDLRTIVRECERLDGMLGSTGIRKSDWWRAMVVVAFTSGARIGAIRSLAWSDVDLPNRLVRFRPETAKTSQEQIQRLHQQAAEALMAIAKPTRLLVFPWPWRRRRKLWEDWKSILVSAGLPRDRYHAFHSLRKSCFTHTALHSDVATASRQCGHMTDLSAVYLDRNLMGDVQAADVLPRL